MLRHYLFISQIFYIICELENYIKNDIEKHNSQMKNNTKPEYKKIFNYKNKFPLKQKFCMFVDESREGYIIQHCNDICGADEVCKKLYSARNYSYYTCTKKPVYRKNGEECSYAGDCISRRCSQGTCVPKSQAYDNCTNFSDCPNAYKCDGICIALMKENENCKNESCAYGLECHNDKCERWGTIDNNVTIDEINKEKLCKSGIAAEFNEDENITTIRCVEVERDADCRYHEQLVNVSFKGGQTLKSSCKMFRNTEGERVYFLEKYNTYKTKFWKKYLEELQKLDPYYKMISEMNNYDVTRPSSWGYEAGIKFQVYKNAGFYFKSGLVNEDGKINYDCQLKSDELDLSSSFVKYNLLLLFSLIFILN